MESFITLSTQLTNYAAFSHGNLAVDTLSKLVSTLQDCANALSQVKCETANTFLSRNKFLECLPSLFTYCWQTTCKSQDSFINWTCGKLSTSSLVRFLKQKLFWSSVEGFKIASCVVPKTRYIHSIAHSRWWPLFLFNHLRTVLVEALLRDTCNARRICRSVWQQSVALFNELWEQKITSCARGDRICPTLCSPRRMPPRRRNVAVLSHAEYVPTLTATAVQPPYALRPRWVKRPGDLDLWTFDLESSVRLTCDVGYLCAKLWSS